MSAYDFSNVNAKLLSEHDNEIPAHWNYASIPTIAEIIMGQSPPGTTYNNSGTGLPFFQGKADFGEITPSIRVYCSSPRKIAVPGDILMSVRAPVGPTNLADRECAIGRGLAILRPKHHILSKYLLYAIRRNESELLLSGNGSTFSAISKKDLNAFKIPIPSLDEQRRIVAKLEALLARRKAAADHLARAEKLLKAFRQSTLAAAISGHLTESWREKQQSNFCKSEIDADDFGILHTTALPDIPDSWIWRLLPSLGELSRGKSRHRPRNAPHLYGGSYPFIQTGDIAQSGGRITNHNQTYNDEGMAQSRLWPTGTVCITIAANIADSAITTYPVCFPDSVVGFIANTCVCLPQFIEYFMRTIRNDLSQYAPATAQKNINLAILNQVAVPLPSLMEQNEIVRRVNQYMNFAESIEKRIDASKFQIEHLSQSILTQAFRGELVPTETEVMRTSWPIASATYPQTTIGEIPPDEVDALFYPRTDADRAVRSVACAVLEQVPSLSGTDHLEAVLLATHPRICRIFLNTAERRAFDKACKTAPQPLFLADGVPVNWQECRDHLEKSGHISIDHFVSGQLLARTATSTLAFTPAVAAVSEIARFALMALKQVQQARRPSARLSQDKLAAALSLQRLAEVA